MDYSQSSIPAHSNSIFHHNFTLSHYKNSFLAGYVGLSTSFAIMHPLDTLKTRLQATTATPASNKLGMIFNKNLFKVLRKGFFGSVAGAGPQGGARLSTYEITKYHLHNTFECSALSSVVIAAILGDFASSIVKVPREVVTSIQQASNSGSLVNVVRGIYKESGIKGFFRGFWSIAGRDVLFMSILFGSYESVKAGVKDKKISFGISDAIEVEISNGGSPSLGLCSLIGGLSGAFAGFLTNPFDVVKTRIMLNNNSSRVFSMTREIYKKAGFRGFLVGSLTRSFWWFGICGIFFPVYETTKKYLHSNDYAYNNK